SSVPSTTRVSIFSITEASALSRIPECAFPTTTRTPTTETSSRSNSSLTVLSTEASSVIKLKIFRTDVIYSRGVLEVYHGQDLKLAAPVDLRLRQHGEIGQFGSENGIEFFSDSTVAQ